MNYVQSGNFRRDVATGETRIKELKHALEQEGADFTKRQANITSAVSVGITEVNDATQTSIAKLSQKAEGLQQSICNAHNKRQNKPGRDACENIHS